MIARPTVFVLGAGAHCPYGFPDGRGLIDDIVAALPQAPEHWNGNRFVDDFMLAYQDRLGAMPTEVIRFRNQLDNSGHSSIDSFLATFHKIPGFPEIGKFAVARALMPREFKNVFARSGLSLQTDNWRKPNQDWMSELFAFMQQGCRNSAGEFLTNNKVSFVTFNYDRTLEYFLHLRLANTYGLPEDVAWDQAKTIEIAHVYGSLGEFSPELIRKAEKPYSPQEMKTAAESIWLMYEQRDHDVNPNIAAAISLIQCAEVVCFLGFAFDSDNVARLRLNEILMGKRVFATRYGVADGDWERAKLRIAPAGLAHSEEHAKREWDSLMFLRETRALG